ncbi:MAG: membrane protein insertase YidC [Chloroflexi bacterium]|nr:membrane protein insertase YidC [Chloroflexota bacterium]
MNITDIWNFLLVHPLLSLLVGAFDLFHDFGIAVVLVTVAIRLLLYPLYVTQIRSQRAMQELAPAMNDIKAKYGSDRKKLSEEQMKLYKERGYNPATGCLPLLLQMPILFAMYAAFLQAPTLDGSALSGILMPFVPNPLSPDQKLDLTAHWLPWIRQCVQPDGSLLHGLGCPDPWKVLPILAGATQLFASVMAQPANQPKSDDPQQRMMQSMAYYFPLITVFIAWSLPAGLAVYWVTTTLFQIGQQYVVTGWGQLPKFLPFLRNIPSPGERGLRDRQAALIREAESDMRARGAIEGPGAQAVRETRRDKRDKRDKTAKNKRRR